MLTLACLLGRPAATFLSGGYGIALRSSQPVRDCYGIDQHRVPVCLRSAYRRLHVSSTLAARCIMKEVTAKPPVAEEPRKLGQPNRLQLARPDSRRVLTCTSSLENTSIARMGDAHSDPEARLEHAAASTSTEPSDLPAEHSVLAVQGSPVGYISCLECCGAATSVTTYCTTAHPLPCS